MKNSKIILPAIFTILLMGCGKASENNVSTTPATTPSYDSMPLATGTSYSGNTRFTEQGYTVKVNSKSPGHPSSGSVFGSYYYVDRIVADLTESLSFGVSIYALFDDLTQIHPDYESFEKVNCFGMDGYVKEYYGNDHLEFFELSNGPFEDDYYSVVILFPYNDDLYLAAVINYSSYFSAPDDPYEYLIVKDGKIVNTDGKEFGDYEIYDYHNLLNDEEFLSFDSIEVIKD